ncbi:MAG: 3-hydroxyacyl-ACP dehydratase FabZ [Candidatus Omnitrophota bacterium]|nr:MAG: 3-hydroxyacyl-ACP dehydratase FabZ [Candidatus Omnitrophota bacterium]
MVINKILPQKYPFLFIDKVLEVNKTKGKATCLKNVTINEYFFQGHFPGKPIMPGVLIIEAMAQAGIVLYAALKPHIAEKNPDYFLGKVEAKFIGLVKPGDKLILEAVKEKLTDRGGVVETVAKVDDQVVAKAKIVLGVKE